MSEAILSVRGVTKRYGEAAAVNEVDLDIGDGEFMTFLGPSGSGKSTLLYVVAGFEDATEGDVTFKGRSLLNVPPNRRDIGMVFQRYTLFPHMSVEENIAFPLRVRKWPANKMAQRVREMLSLVRLEGYADRKPSQLSGGQQQRIALARALAYDPALLLMDEPLAALDKKLKEEIQLEIRRIHRETGVTILYVTHDQEEALRLSDRIAVLNEGRIEQVGTGQELYEHPSSRFVAGFIGNSNFIPVRISERRQETVAAACPDGTLLENLRIHSDLGSNDAGILMVRPEQLRLVRKMNGTVPHGLPVTLTDFTYLGDSVQITAETAWNQEISIRAPVEEMDMRELSTGSTITIDWPESHGWVFDSGD